MSVLDVLEHAKSEWVPPSLPGRPGRDWYALTGLSLPTLRLRLAIEKGLQCDPTMSDKAAARSVLRTAMPAKDQKSVEAMVDALQDAMKRPSVQAMKQHAHLKAKRAALRVISGKNTIAM